MKEKAERAYLAKQAEERKKMLAKVKKVNKKAVVFISREGSSHEVLGRIDRSKKMILPTDSLPKASTLQDLISFLDKYPNAKAQHHKQAKPGKIIDIYPMWMLHRGKRHCYGIQVQVEKKNDV